MLKKTNYLLFLLIWAACVLPPKSISETPDWYLNIPAHPDTTYGVGVDKKGEIYAIAAALITIGLATNTSIEGSKKRTRNLLESDNDNERYLSTTNSYLDFILGDLTVTGLEKSQQDSSKEGDSNTFMQVYEIISSNFMIKSSYQEKDNKIIMDEKSSTAMNTNDLINELKKNGATVTLDSNNNMYYCLIGIPNSEIKYKQ